MLDVLDEIVLRHVALDLTTDLGVVRLIVAGEDSVFAGHGEGLFQGRAGQIHALVL